MHQPDSEEHRAVVRVIDLVSETFGGNGSTRLESNGTYLRSCLSIKA